MHSFQVFDDVIFFVEQPVVEQNLIFVKKSIGKNDGEMLFKKTALFKFRYFGKLEIYFFYFGFYNLAFADAFCVLFKNTVPEQCLNRYGDILLCGELHLYFSSQFLYIGKRVVLPVKLLNFRSKTIHKFKEYDVGITAGAVEQSFRLVTECQGLSIFSCFKIPAEKTAEHLLFTILPFC